MESGSGSGSRKAEMVPEINKKNEEILLFEDLSGELEATPGRKFGHP
jgi:hypothetical protein